MSNIAIRKHRGSTLSLAAITVALGDVFVDLTKPTVVVGDGTTLGGVPLAKEVHVHANATTMTAGFLSATDKTKLDLLSVSGGVQSLETNTAPVTPRQVLNFSSEFAVADNSGALRTEIALASSVFDRITSDTIALIVALS